MSKTASLKCRGLDRVGWNWQGIGFWLRLEAELILLDTGGFRYRVALDDDLLRNIGAALVSMPSMGMNVGTHEFRTL